MKTKKKIYGIGVFKIEKNVPLPKIIRTYALVDERNEMIKSTISQMEVGESFYISTDKFLNKKKDALQKSINSGRVNQIYTIINKNKLAKEAFKCEADAKGGVRVWRTK